MNSLSHDPHLSALLQRRNIVLDSTIKHGRSLRSPEIIVPLGAPIGDYHHVIGFSRMSSAREVFAVLYAPDRMREGDFLVTIGVLPPSDDSISAT